MAGGEDPGAATVATATAPADQAGQGTRDSQEGLAARQPAPARAKGAEQSEVDDPTFKPQVQCLMNARYHRAREAFLDRAHRLAMFVVVLSGAAALIDIGGKGSAWEHTFALAAVVAGTADLVFSLSERARTHAFLKRRYAELLAELESEGEAYLPKLKCALHTLAGEEEPIFYALQALAYNRALRTLGGREDDELIVSWRDRFLKNFWRAESVVFVPKRRAKASVSKGDHGVTTHAA